MQPLCSSSVLLASLTPPLMSLLSSRGVTEQALWNEGVVGGEKRGTAPATLGGFFWLVSVCTSNYTQNLSSNCFSMSSSKGSKRSGIDEHPRQTQQLERQLSRGGRT